MSDSNKQVLGYACINMGFSERPKKQRITTNRTMIKRTFKDRGLAYASELALQNAKDLKKILEWNTENDINFFRMSSGIFSWASEYDIKDLPDYDQIAQALGEAGAYARSVNQRLTTHPDHFNKLTSPHERVIKNTVRDLEIHGELFDLLGQPRTPWAKINIHVGATYGDKPMAIDNFCRNFERLSPAVKSRLTVENDDRASLYSTAELVEEIHGRIGIPVVHDFHHHLFTNRGMSQKEALGLACSTWGDVIPVVHYSESRAKEYNDPKIRPQAHSDRIVNYIDTYGYNVHVMIEAKHKEIALLEYRNKHDRTNLIKAA
jgi:UV DNA damage endonuclease